MRFAFIILVATVTRSASAANVDFSRDILPILSTRCFVCHGPDVSSRQADLRLDERDAALAEGTEAPAIVPGNPAASAMIARLTSDDPDVRMPPPDKGPALSADEVALIRAWIEQGAEYTEHWAFVRAVKAPIPDVHRAGWEASPIDRFILQRLKQEGLEPAGPASRETLIRRATLDLTGLPPTPDEVAAFVAGPWPDAYEQLVDRLLASPHYGERWGRHWLDVARFADSGGFETDIFFGHAWRYRDYVIRSFNADKPFDQFVKEQIAGDEIAVSESADTSDSASQTDATAEARIATGLYTIGPVLQEAAMVKGQLSYDLLTDAADVTGSAFLGLTVGCARCHDHKYDPIKQTDYYGLQAIFAASDQFDFDEAGKQLRGGVALRKTLDEFKQEQLRSRARDAQDAAQRDDYLRQVGEFYIDQDRDLRAQLDQADGYAAYFKALAHYRQAAAAYESGTTENAERDQLLRDVGEAALNLAGEDRESRRALRRMTREERDAYYADYGRDHLRLSAPEGLIADADAFRLEIGRRHLNDPSVIPVRALAHRDAPLEVRILGRGELTNPLDAAVPRVPAKLANGLSLAGAPPEKWRTALADWIASPENPLTARVIVNRVWQWHFGEGLVRTPNDFGARGERPTHPELLDWLTADFVEHGWSLKQLHRAIMISSAYRMSADASAEAIARDPDNLLLARYQPHRLEAEMIWDSVRAAAGTLNLAMYGLPVAPPLDEQEEIGNYKDWPTSTPEESARRGVYLLTRRSFRFPMLSAFDLPDNATSCGRRDVTTIPNQCLTLLNNRTIEEQAARFAQRLLRETDGKPTSVAPLAWRYAYGRVITRDEQSHVTAFLTTREAELAGKSEAAQTALNELCLAIFNTNEFIYVP